MEFYLSDPNLRLVFFGILIMSSTTAVVGNYAFLRKRSLIGDAISHSIFPGICLGFLFTDSKNPVFLLVGAFATGWLAVFLIDYFKNNSKIKEDSAIALVMSVFFGIGIVLLTYIQQSKGANQSGLDKFLFGQAASIVETDVIVFGSVALLSLVVVLLLFREFKLICFDPVFAKSIGYPIKTLEAIITSLTVLAIVVGIRSVGVVLMSAMLIAPAAAARFWTNNLSVMMVVSILFTTISTILGCGVSYAFEGMPTGPWIVMIMSFLAILTFLFAPQKGSVNKYFRDRMNWSRIEKENILKKLYQIGEVKNDFFQPIFLPEVANNRHTEIKISQILKKLKNDGFVIKTKGNWYLSAEGKAKGQKMIKLHRLWEFYLTEKVHIAPDHVHDNSEMMEHIISPEMEEKLEKALNYPKKDPHSKEIPY